MIIICPGQSAAQNDNAAKLINKADKFFQVHNYAEACKLFQEAVESGASDPMVLYKLGKSYFESDQVNDKIKAIPYFEKAGAGDLKLQPYHFYLDLGDAYLLNEQVDQALLAYNKDESSEGRDAKAKMELEQRIKTAKVASGFINNPKKVKIVRLGNAINTEYTEYNPVVSADESVLAYTAYRPNTGNTRTGDKFLEQIEISYNETGSWAEPKKVEVQTLNNYGTAGISADGQEMMIYIGDHSSGSLYTINKEGDNWSRPTPVGAPVSSKYLESTASITPDGKTIYFASNRPGGYGGMDIYKAEKLANGSWGKVQNLGPQINSKADDDAPFIHPSKNMLFFMSNGPNSMGGFDIFKSTLENGQWSKRENMGYPINTPANDSYFTLIADGSRGYFSSDRKGGAGGQDIYMMNMPKDFETIPLTMIKGRILNAETGKPLNTKISVVDNQTNKKLDFVYRPNKTSGDYLVILPPNKSYDMIIESDGYLPYTLNIDVPNQTSFYELYQKIYLNTIKHFDVVVGQEVEVQNAFYNTQQGQVSDLRKEHEAALIDSDSIDVYELMGNLMDASDQDGIDYLLSLVMMKNPIDNVKFDSTNAKIQTAKRTYYYDESDSSKFEKKQVGDEVVYSLPTMNVTEEAEEQKHKPADKPIRYDKSLLAQSLKIYFDAAKSDLDANYHKDLDNILATLQKYPELGVEISGFASPEGDEAYNEKLSNKRAISVLDYINQHGVVRRRIVARGYGATQNANVSKEKSRRVEVKIIDLDRM